MPRKRRPLVRESAVRDARLIVIATEDSEATVAYFEAFVSPHYYQNTKVQVNVLNRDDTNSAPEYTLEMLDKYREEYQIAENDELWLVIDVDRWGDRKLSKITAAALQKNIQLAVSNPAIEIWFVLHVAQLHEYPDEQRSAFLENKKESTGSKRTAIDRAIVDKIGRYNKSKLNVDDFLPHVRQAIEQAEQLDINPEERWPTTLGTHVYRLAQSILDSKSTQ